MLPKYILTFWGCYVPGVTQKLQVGLCGKWQRLACTRYMMNDMAPLWVTGTPLHIYYSMLPCGWVFGCRHPQRISHLTDVKFSV